MKTKLIDLDRNTYVGIGSVFWKYQDIKNLKYENIVEIYETGVEDVNGVMLYLDDIVLMDDEEWVVRYVPRMAKYQLVQMNYVHKALRLDLTYALTPHMKQIGNDNLKRKERTKITGIG